MNKTMKAMVLAPAPAGDREGAPVLPVLEEREVPVPAPREGEAVVALRAAALNRRDVFIRQGKYAGIRLPCILGSDGAGVVSAVGAGVAPEWIGAEVVINPALSWGPDPAVQADDFRILGMPDPGTFAEQVAVPAAKLVRKPAHLRWEEAAALPLGGLTAYRALRRGGLRPGETVLITGIGGGVATLLLMLARHLGARVLVTSSSNAKLQHAAQLGAAAGVNHHDPDWDRQLLLQGPVDLAVDGAGGDTFARCLAVVRPGGRVVSYGATTGAAKVEVRRIFWKQLSVQGSTMGTDADFAEMIALVGAGQLRPVIDDVMPLSQAALALTRMQQGEQTGKLVLRTH